MWMVDGIQVSKVTTASQSSQSKSTMYGSKTLYVLILGDPTHLVPYALSPYTTHCTHYTHLVPYASSPFAVRSGLLPPVAAHAQCVSIVCEYSV
jgi:hypothetical protein